MEAFGIVPVRSSEQRSGRTFPWECGELVDSRDQERRKPAVKRLVDPDDRQGAVGGKLALEVAANDPHVARAVGVGQKSERLGYELSAAPRAALNWNRGGTGLRVGLVPQRLPARGVASAIALSSHAVRGGGLADPKSDLEGPLAVPAGIRCAFQLERAHQSRRTGQLVERKEAQRIAHDHADTRARPSSISCVAKAPQHHREGGEPEIGFGLPAPGGEEEQIHGLTVATHWIRHARKVEEQERKLEGPPLRIRRLLPLEPPRERALERTG